MDLEGIKLKQKRTRTIDFTQGIQNTKVTNKQKLKRQKHQNGSYQRGKGKMDKWGQIYGNGMETRLLVGSIQ